jgi:hypothetical protein
MAYPALEVGQAGNAPCPDKYNEASTLICPGSNRLVLQVSKQAVFVQLGVMPQGRGVGGGSVVWQSEQPFLPVIASLGRAFDAVRVRNYTPKAEAQVLVSVEAI